MALSVLVINDRYAATPKYNKKKIRMNDPIKAEIINVRIFSLIIPQTKDKGVVGIIGIERRNMRIKISFHDPVKRLPILSTSRCEMFNHFPNRPVTRFSVLSAKK